MEHGRLQIKDVVVIGLAPGELVLESIEAIVEKEGIKDAVILTGFGTLSQVHLHWVTTTGFPPVEHFERYEGPFELLALHGVIAGGEPHIHAVVSDTRHAYGGHLEKGNKVLYLCEIVIGVLEGASMKREMTSQGVRLLKIG